MEEWRYTFIQINDTKVFLVIHNVIYVHASDAFMDFLAPVIPVYV